MTRSSVRSWFLAVLPFLAGCGLTDVQPDPALLDSFVQSLDAASLEEIVLSNSAQVEVALLPGGLTASVVSVRSRSRSDEERISSRVVDVSPSANAGSVQLLLGGINVYFDGQSRFWIGDVEVERNVFFDEILSRLASGQEPAVVAERPVPDEPQHPDDDGFVASHVVLGGDGEPEIRMDVDADNLIMVANPQPGDPDGYLRLLGLSIQLRISEGITELDSHDHDYDEMEDFEGVVSSVDVANGLVTLGDGWVVRVVDQTQIKDGDGLLTSLADVAASLESGNAVVAWGVGVVESNDPVRLLALKIAFKARHEHEPDYVEFEGHAVSVNLAEGYFELGDGTKIHVVDDTDVRAYDDHSPNSLQALAEALEAGNDVVAWGKAVVESDDPLVLVAHKVVFKCHEPEPDHEEFEGHVVAVDAANGLVTFDHGLVVMVGPNAEVVGYNDHSPMSLDEAEQALVFGRVLFAWGGAEVESDGSVVAFRIVFKTPIEDFEQDVASIDAAANSVVLENGWVLQATSDTAIQPGDANSSADLSIAAASLAAGDRIRVWGFGYVLGENPVTLELISLTVLRIPSS